MGVSGVVFIEGCLLLVGRHLDKGPRLALLFWKVQLEMIRIDNTTTIVLICEIMPIECIIVSLDYDSLN